MINLLTATILCTGVAPTTPATNIEVEVKPAAVKYSTIRYEIAEGSLAGTAYIQSIGHMVGSKKGSIFTFKTGDGVNDTLLTIQTQGEQIIGARFSHYISSMKDAPVDCSVEEDSGDHSGH